MIAPAPGGSGHLWRVARALLKHPQPLPAEHETDMHDGNNRKTGATNGGTRKTTTPAHHQSLR